MALLAGVVTIEAPPSPEVFLTKRFNLSMQVLLCSMERRCGQHGGGGGRNG